ncbi:hypothetical protein OUZ56_002650 [Daphnia magna]|uniref:LIM zinc-binding domain-containing protein n=1 Tax=Daphnia magna TaxID=35525 RepID=A0ABR0A6V2_9CRUS|nr:hypothetical protein OUZ56_002650 [Daphnia magna]
MMNPMNHMATHFPGDMGGYGQHHTGPGPGSPAQQQAHGAGGPVDGMNGFRAMQQQQQQQQQQPAGPNAMFQGPAMESQQQRSMMGSNAHMAGGQVVTNNMMNGSSMALGPGPMNGMMNMQMPPQQQQQQQQSQMGAGGMQQQHMMQQQPQQHMGVHMDGSNMVGGGGGGPVVGQQQQQGGNGQGVRACAGCGGKILERFLFHALDRFWHHGCLKCSCCGARLADIGVSCYTKAGMILCRADYVRLFGSSGACSACGQGIPANELVMRVGGAGPAGGPGGGGGGGPNGIHPPSGGGGNAAGGVYHVKCFACTKCQTQLMPGDRYALIGGSLLCEQDCHKMMKNNNNNNNNNNNANNNNHAGPGGGGAGVGGGGGGGGGGVNQPPGAGGPGATGTNASTGGSGGGPVRKGKVGRPRRSRD